MTKNKILTGTEVQRASRSKVANTRMVGKPCPVSHGEAHSQIITVTMLTHHALSHLVGTHLHRYISTRKGRLFPHYPPVNVDTGVSFWKNSLAHVFCSTGFRSVLLC